MTLKPRTEVEIAAIVRRAAAAGRRVRVVGSQHSVPAAFATDGEVISLDDYRGITAHDGARVTVRAGTSIRELATYLAEHGLALPVMGGISCPSVGGFLSTGAAGGSLRHGLGASVHALRLVTADGGVVDIDRDHPWFGAAGVSLGLLGIVSAATFDCVPHYGVRGTEHSTDIATAIEEFETWAAGNDYCRVLWWPGIDRCDVWRANRCEAGVETLGIQRLSPALQRAAHVANWLGTRARNLTFRPLWRLFAKRQNRVFSGPYYEVLPQEDGLSPRLLPHLYTELWVPFSCVQAAMTAVADYFEKGGLDAMPSLPMEFYASPATDSWLSPGYQRPSLRVNMTIYGHDPRGPEQLARGLWDALAPFDPRAHWGKYQLTSEHGLPTTRNYPKWDDFAELRATLDPRGVFLNPHWQRIFATQGVETPADRTGAASPSQHAVG